jgi:hypothetical protein
MPGPVPKNRAQRRRRNAESPGQMLPSGGKRGRPPKPHTSVQWGEHARAYWTAIWTSPMAVTFTKTDEFALTRLCSLVDRRERVETGDHEVFEATAVDGMVTVVRGFDGDAEIRQLEDRYGLSAMSRRRLQWEITSPEGAEDDPGELAPVTQLKAV